MTATTHPIESPAIASPAARRAPWKPVIGLARRLVSSARAMAAAGQLGSLPEREIGRRTGARG